MMRAHRTIQKLENELVELRKKMTPAPVIEIIAVTHVKGQKIHSVSQGIFGVSDKVVEGVATIVLYSEGGALRTKDLPGTWSLEEVQKGSSL